MTIRILAACLMTMILFAGCGGSKPARDGGHGQRGYRYFLNGSMDRAMDQYKRGYAAARRTDDVRLAAAHLANIGRVYAEIGHDDSAAQYFARSYDEFTALNDSAAAARSAAQLAATAAALGNNALADKWFQTAAAKGGGLSDFKHYLAVIRGKIDMRLSSKINNGAELSDAVKHYQKKKDFSSLATIRILMGEAELAQKKCAAAENFLLDALSFIDKTQETYRRSNILLKLSETKFCQGDDAAGKRYLDRARGCAPRGVIIQ